MTDIKIKLIDYWLNRSFFLLRSTYQPSDSQRDGAETSQKLRTSSPVENLSKCGWDKDKCLSWVYWGGKQNWYTYIIQVCAWIFDIENELCSIHSHECAWKPFQFSIGFHWDRECSPSSVIYIWERKMWR